MNALPVDEDEDDDEDDDDVEELDDVAPPPMNCPTAPFKLAIVPSTGAVSTAAPRMFWGVCSATWAFPTCALAVSRSAWVGGARVCEALATCVRTAAWFWASVVCPDCRV